MPSPTFEPEHLVELARLTEIAPSPCGTWAAVVAQRLDNKGAKYVSDIWRVPLEGGGSVIRLTQGAAGAWCPSFRADGALAFLSRRPLPDEESEDEPVAQVWLLPATGGEARPLTNEPLGISDFGFAPEGDRLFAISNLLLGVDLEDQRETAKDRRKHGPSALRYRTSPVRFWDHWLPEAAPHLILFDGEGRNRIDLTPEADREHRHGAWSTSRTGDVVVITTNRPSADRVDDTALTVIDCRTGESRELGWEPHTSLSAPLVSPDGRRVVVSHHRRSSTACGRLLLRVYDLETGSYDALAEHWDAWPNPHDWIDDSTLLCTADVAGRVPVYALDASTSSAERLSSEASGGAHMSLRYVRAKRLIIGLRHTFLHPPEPFSLLPVHGSEPRLLASMSGIDEATCRDYGRIEEHEIEADDGARVHAWLILPSIEATRPGRGLMWIHGGPIHQWSDSWHWRWNPLIATSRGYAVCMPNPRGSTGFGQTFVEGIWGNAWGDQCYRDIVAVTDWFQARNDVAAHRVAAMGASFGGYMTNWIGANTDRFCCLVSHAGIYSITAFHGVTDHPAWLNLEMGFPPYDNPADFDRHAPSRFIANWKAPTLVIHGEKDYRVPISEALALFEGLQHHGVPSELLVFPDEGHWIERPRNIIVWYRDVLAFLKRYLGGET